MRHKRTYLRVAAILLEGRHLQAPKSESEVMPLGATSIGISANDLGSPHPSNSHVESGTLYLDVIGCKEQHNAPYDGQASFAL
jgi:hypothetical protein